MARFCRTQVWVACNKTAGASRITLTGRIAVAALLALLTSCSPFNYGGFFERYLVDVDRVQPNPNNEFTVRFLGNTNLLISDGHESILIDSFFSYPNKGGVQTFFEPVEPDSERVDAATTAPEFSKLKAIIVTHSHHDHALDVGEVATKFSGAHVVGSESTFNILEGWTMWCESKPECPTDRNSILGRFLDVNWNDGGSFQPDIKSESFKVTILPGRHAKTLLSLIEDKRIEEPLVPPRRITDYAPGDVYIIHVEHTSSAQSLVVVGTAGVPDKEVSDAIFELGADVLFLAVSAMPSKPEKTRLYLERTIDAAQPNVVVPFHWDSQLEAPKEGRVVEPRGLYAWLAQVDNGLETVRDHIESDPEGRKLCMVPFDRPVAISKLVRVEKCERP